MDKDIFISQVFEQLQKMPAGQKDAWILTKAKLLSEAEQQDFMMSLTGEKLITYMPAEDEIRTFCEKVQNGDIVMEYETHYCEFNSEGRYIDDWITHYNDPYRAFHFLNRTFEGCHDLIRLKEFNLAGRILDKICRLEIQVVEAEDSEDFGDDSPFTIADAEKEHLLSMDAHDIAYDWVVSLLLGGEYQESTEFARKLMEILKFKLCKSIQPSGFYEFVSEKFLNMIEEILEEEISEIRAEMEGYPDRHKYWRKINTLEEKMARNQHFLLDIRKNCRKQSDGNELARASVLKASWEQICELFHILKFEPYIDDQIEIDEIWNICEALVRRGRLEEESWELRESILRDMISHEFYDYYGCYDPVKKLADQLYITETEILKFADMLNEHGYYAREAAELYRQHGRMDQYIRYLETHLDRSSKEYVELVQCYSSNGNDAGARTTAELGLKKCRDDLTELFIFLLQDAKNSGDEAVYKKLYASAKRRKKVNISKINEMMTQ